MMKKYGKNAADAKIYRMVFMALLLSLLILFGNICCTAVFAAENTAAENSAPASSLSESLSDESESSYPFGEMPDMKNLIEALRIIDGTPLDELSDEQQAQLSELGYDRETLDKNRALIEELSENPPDEEQTDTAEKSTPDTGAASQKSGWAVAVLGGILLIAGIFFIFSAHSPLRKPHG